VEAPLFIAEVGACEMVGVVGTAFGRIVPAGIIVPALVAGLVEALGLLAVIDGVVMEGELMDGELIDGEVIDGEVMEGEDIDGELIDGAIMEGELIDGAIMEGELMDGAAMLGAEVIAGSGTRVMVGAILGPDGFECEG
jgi:hypothetical protein